METLGERLKRARLTAPDRMKDDFYKSNVSQADVGKIVGVTRQAIIAVEKDRTKNMPAEKLVKIAEFLRVDATWLITGQSSMIAVDEAHKGNGLPPVIDELAETEPAGMSAVPAENPPAKELTSEELIDLVSVVHALSGQVLDNADKGRNYERILNNLRGSLRELLAQTEK